MALRDLLLPEALEEICPDIFDEEAVGGRGDEPPSYVPCSSMRDWTPHGDHQRRKGGLARANGEKKGGKPCVVATATTRLAKGLRPV